MMIPSIMAYGVCSVPLSIVGASPCGYQTLQSLGFFPNAKDALSLYAHPSTLLQNQQQQQQQQQEQEQQQEMRVVAINQTESSQQQQQQRKNINRKMKVPLIRSTNTQNNNTMEEQENQVVVPQQQQQQQRLRRLRQPPPLPFHATSSSETTETDKETKNNDENDEKQNNTHSEFKSLANRFREQNKQARTTPTPQSQSQQQQQQQQTTTIPLIRNIPTTKLTSSSPSQHPIPLTSSSIITTPSSSSSSSTILSSSSSSKYITLQNNNNNNHHLFFINNNNATPEVTRRVRFVIATIGLVTTIVSYQLHCYNREKEEEKEEEDEMYKVEKYLAKNRRSGNGGGGGTVLRLLNPNQSFPPLTNGGDDDEENGNVCILPVVYTPLSAYSLQKEQKEQKRMHWKLGKSPKEYMNFTPLSSNWFFYDNVSKKDNDADQNKNKTKEEEEDMKKPFLLMEANISTPFYSHITTHSTAPSSSSSSNTNAWSKLNTLLKMYSSKKKNENEKTMKSLPSSAQNNNDENSHDGLTIHQVRNASRILDTIASKRIIDDSSGVDNECKNNVKVVNVLMETTDQQQQQQQQQYNDNHHHNENEIILNGVKAVENRLKSLLYQKIKKTTTRNIPKKADNEKNLAMSSVQKEVVDVADKDEEEKDTSVSSGYVTNNIESQTNEKGGPKEKETTTIQTQTIEELQQQPQVQEMYSPNNHNNNNNNNYFSILSIIDTIGSNIRQSGEYAANTIITSSIQVVRRQEEWKNYCINYWKERNLVEQVKKNAKMIFLSFTFLPSLESMSLLPLSMPLFKKQERRQRQRRRQVLYVVSNDQRVAWWVQNMLDLDELNVVWIDSAKSTDGSGSGAISPVAASANDVDPSMTSTSTTLAVSSVSLNHGSAHNTNMEEKSAADNEEDKDGIILVCCTNDDANCDVACSILSSRNDLAESGKMIVLFENQSSKDTFDLLTRQILISSSSSLSSSSQEKEVQVEEQNQRNDSGGSGAINESGIDSICVESIYEEMFDYTRWLLGKGKSLSEVQSIMMNDALSIKERTKKG